MDIMKGRPFLTILTLLGIAIIIAAMNDFQLMPTKPPMPQLSEAVAGKTLFVCPAKDPAFDGLAKELTMFQRQISTFYMFLVMLWLAVFGWTLYQSLLKDKFEEKSYDVPIFFAEFLIFGFVLMSIMMRAPNYYRRVEVRGASGEYVLCESDSPGARPVKAAALAPGSKR